MFPVGWVAQQKASREIFFFLSFSVVIDCDIMFDGKKNFFSKTKKKKFQSALLNPLWRSTGNNFLFKGGLMKINLQMVKRAIFRPIFLILATLEYSTFRKS